mgnify:CR=1 FL=1
MISPPLDVWYEVMMHMTNADRRGVSRICRCANNAVRIASDKIIDIRVNALYRLWLMSEPASFFWRMFTPPPRFDRDAAREAVTGYVDYFQGRMIKVDFSRFVEGDVSVFHEYDRHFGVGRASAIFGWSNVLAREANRGSPWF